MIISHKHKFCLFQPPKTGGSSLEVAFSKYCGPDDVITPMPRRPEADETEIQDPQQNVGTYHQHGDPITFKPPEGYMTICPVRNPFELYVSFMFWHKKIDLREAMDKYWKWDLNRFWNYPHNYWIRFEHLQEDFDKVCEAFGFEQQTLPRLKTKMRPRNDNYREHYDEQLKNVVMNSHQQTIEKFNYKF